MNGAFNTIFGPFSYKLVEDNWGVGARPSRVPCPRLLRNWEQNISFGLLDRNQSGRDSGGRRGSR